MRYPVVRRRHRVLSLALVGLLAATVAGASASTAQTAPTARSADRNGEFRFALPWGYTGWDPIKVANPGPDFQYLTNVYDSLLAVSKDSSGTIGPGPRLATSYKVAPDGMSISLELRTGVKFQDGNPFNAAAVKANLERAKGSDSKSAAAVSSIQSVEVVDDTHVTIRLSRVDPSIPWALTYLPGFMVSPAAFNSDLMAKPVGTGPYTIVSASKDSGAVFERWTGYWDKKAPVSQKLTVSSVPDENARFNGLRSGQYDAALLNPPNDVAAQELTKDGYHHLLVLSAAQHRFVLNTAKPPFDNVEVRRAVNMAINRKEIVNGLLHISRPAYQIRNRGHVGYVKALDKDPYDPKAARKLVQQAGATGATVKLMYPTLAPLDALAQAVQQQLNDIGLKVELTPVEPAVSRQTWARGQYDGFLITTGPPEPSQALRLGFFQVPTGTDTIAPTPPELLDLINKATTLPSGSAEQVKAFQDVSRWLVKNPIHMPIVSHWSVIVSRPDVVGTETMMLVTVSDLDFRQVGKRKTK